MALLEQYNTPLRAIWRIEEPSEEMEAFLRRKAVDLSGLEALKTEKRRQEWLAVRLLLMELLGEEQTIAYSPNGAPYLPDSSRHISISHTRGYAAVLLQDKPFAGIDIEYRSERALRLRTKFMSPQEEQFIDAEREADHLLLCWCAKEALFKMIGEEDVDFREHLHIEPFPFALAGTFTVRETRTPQKQSFQLAFSVENDYLWTWSI